MFITDYEDVKKDNKIDIVITGYVGVKAEPQLHFIKVLI